MLGSALAWMAAPLLAACFVAPQPVQVAGWSGDAMEPFLSRDGAALFFNSSNAVPDRTDIYWAKREDAQHFTLVGPVPGANSPALDGVPSLSRDGAFALISPRAYGRLHATIWIGRWTGSAVEKLEPQPQLAPPGPGGFNMDAEISADGDRLYLTENRWSPFGPPSSSRLRLARRTRDGWRTDPAADAWFAAVNARDALVYAPALSEDERELYFTRLPHGGLPSLWVATRASADAAFGPPARIAAVQGFSEGPTVAPDGALYFHLRRDGRFVIMRSARACEAR